MDSFEFNKIAGAVLATLMVVLGVNILAEEIFTAQTPEEPGYQIAVAEDDPDAPVEEEPAEAPLAVRLAEADAAAGESAVRPCASCHTFEQGGEDRVGPNLYNTVGNQKAHIEGFGYSDAMQEAAAAGEVWDYESLDAFLEDPRGYLPGTTMAFAGVRDPGDRADMILYLRALTDDPPPLPEVEEAPAEEEDVAEAPAEDAEEPAEDAEAPDNDLLAMVGAADPADGESAARPCAACHTFEEGGGNRVGPNLYNVAHNEKAYRDDFNYSDAMEEAAAEGGVWDVEELDAFLENPREYLPGTTMAFAGVRDPEDRAALIAYMRQMSDDPPPLDDSGDANDAADAEEDAEAEEAEAEVEDEAEELEEDAAGEEAEESEEAAEGADEANAEGQDSELRNMVAAADPADGESAARPCAACHTFEEGGGNRVGPNLYGVAHNEKAYRDDFNYSDAMEEAAAEGGVWDVEELDAFLENPRDYLPGTTMAFAGVRDPEDRAALIAYMRQMSDDPPPLE